MTCVCLTKVIDITDGGYQNYILFSFLVSSSTSDRFVDLNRIRNVNVDHRWWKTLRRRFSSAMVEAICSWLDKWSHRLPIFTRMNSNDGYWWTSRRWFVRADNKWSPLRETNHRLKLIKSDSVKNDRCPDTSMSSERRWEVHCITLLINLVCSSSSSSSSCSVLWHVELRNDGSTVELSSLTQNGEWSRTSLNSSRRFLSILKWESKRVCWRAERRTRQLVASLIGELPEMISSKNESQCCH